MSYWIPKPTGKHEAAPGQLDERERLVLSRVDGETSVSHLNLLPSLSERIVRPILDRLVQLGLVEPMSDSEPSLRSEPLPKGGRRTGGGLAALVSPPTRPPTGVAAAVRAEPAPVESMLTEPPPTTEPAPTEPAPTESSPTESDEAFAWIPYDGDEAVEADLVDEGNPAHEDDPVGTDESDPPAVEDSDPSESDPADVDQSEPAEGDADADDPTDADADDGSMPDELALANFRRLYETQLKHLTRDQRIGLAQTVTGEVLCALCYDEFPGVIEAIVSNPN